MILYILVAGVKVFIGYNNHCDYCNEVAHFLGQVLTSTGEVECSLDTWTNERSKLGCKWYEQELEKCDKILFICAGKGKNLFDVIYESIQFHTKNVHSKSL